MPLAAESPMGIVLGLAFVIGLLLAAFGAMFLARRRKRKIWSALVTNRVTVCTDVEPPRKQVIFELATPFIECVRESSDPSGYWYRPLKPEDLEWYAVSDRAIIAEYRYRSWRHFDSCVSVVFSPTLLTMDRVEHVGKISRSPLAEVFGLPVKGPLGMWHMSVAWGRKGVKNVLQQLFYAASGDRE